MGTTWTSQTPPGHAPHVEAATAPCSTGDLLLCRALVHNARMMLDLNPVLATGISTTTVSGTFATKKRTLPAWTSVHVLVRRDDVVHVIVCSHECINLVSLADFLAAQSHSPLNRVAWRRLHTAGVPPTDLATLYGLIDDLLPRLPLTWRDVSAPSLPTTVRAVVQRMCALLRQSVMTIAPAEEDMIRYAFRNQDGDCLGWLFVEDVPKLAPEIEAMGIFKAGTSWVDELQALLARLPSVATDESARFTASDLVVAAKAVQRQHISAEYDVPLYGSAAFAAAFYEHARLLLPEQLLPSGLPKPIVPLAFSQAWQRATSPVTPRRLCKSESPVREPSSDVFTWLVPDLWSDPWLLKPA